MESLATQNVTHIATGSGFSVAVTAERAMRAKRDPSFPDITFSFGPKPAGDQLDWQTRTIASFDFAALAAMLR